MSERRREDSIENCRDLSSSESIELVNLVLLCAKQNQLKKNQREEKST